MWSCLRIYVVTLYLRLGPFRSNKARETKLRWWPRLHLSKWLDLGTGLGLWTSSKLAFYAYDALRKETFVYHIILFKWSGKAEWETKHSSYYMLPLFPIQRVKIKRHSKNYPHRKDTQKFAIRPEETEPYFMSAIVYIQILVRSLFRKDKYSFGVVLSYVIHLT